VFYLVVWKRNCIFAGKITKYFIFDEAKTIRHFPDGCDDYPHGGTVEVRDCEGRAF
jgi:hypothetical protein